MFVLIKPRELVHLVVCVSINVLQKCCLSLICDLQESARRMDAKIPESTWRSDSKVRPSLLQREAKDTKKISIWLSFLIRYNKHHLSQYWEREIKSQITIFSDEPEYLFQG